jgi:hypothetical protein
MEIHWNLFETCSGPALLLVVVHIKDSPVLLMCFYVIRTYPAPGIHWMIGFVIGMPGLLGESF